MGQMIIVPPDETWAGANVTANSPLDASFDVSWATDLAADTPVQASTMNLTIAPLSATMVDVIAVVNHNIEQAATITLGSPLSTTIPTAAWKRNGLPLNWYRRLTSAVSVTSTSFVVSGHSRKVVIGDVFGGKGYTLRGFLMNRKRDPGTSFTWEGQGLQRPPYYNGVSKPRRLSGNIALTDAQLTTLEDWDLATQNGTRPFGLIPDTDINDFWLCTANFSSTHGENVNIVTMEFVEISRNEWYV